MPLNCLLMAGAQRALGLVTRNQAGLKGALNLREALLGLKASEGTSVWVFRGFLLPPGGCFSAAVERPFRVFWELLFFSNGSFPFSCLSFRQQPPGKCYRQQQRICREWQGWELSQENTNSFCFLLFYGILVCFKGLSGAMWRNELFEKVILAQIFWRREGFGEMLPGQDNGGEEGDFPINEKGSKLWKNKKWVQLCHRNDQTLCEHHVEKINRTEQSIKVKPHDYCGTGLLKFYCLWFFLVKSVVLPRNLTISVLRCLLWRALPGPSTFPLKFQELADAWFCSVSWVGGQEKSKLTGNLFSFRLC